MAEKDNNDFFQWYSDRRPDRNRDDNPFSKVIFLDIDGVLNDDGKNRSSGTYVDREMVKNLAYIVKNTNADIILTSSWRLGYKRFMDNGFQSNEKEYMQLYECFSTEGLTVKGTTPLSNESGPSARPFEIREWLNRFHTIFSYVILDDDTFWSWGFLQRNVVTTRTLKNPPDDYKPFIKGLTMKHAEKAISILNDIGADSYKF